MSDNKKRPRGWSILSWHEWLSQHHPKFLKRHADLYLSKDHAKIAQADREHDKLDAEFCAELERREAKKAQGRTV